MITLKDIAKEANVSLMTVSNVVNGNSHKVSKEKAEEIQAILKKRGYVQNASARSLAKANSNIIAIMLRSLPSENSLSSPHNATLVGAVIEKIQRLGYYAMVSMVQKQEDIVKSLKTWNVRGAIFLGMFDDEIEQIYDLSSIPMVFIDSYSNMRQLSSVGIDDYKGARLAAEYLFGKGHRAIAFISPPEHDNSVIQHRLRGFVDALKKHDLILPDRRRLTLESDVDPRAVAQATQTLLSMKDEITAAFVTSDQMAASLIGSLYAHGIYVPKDLSIVGFDNMLISTQVSPQLTTIAQDLEQKAAFAVEILEHRLSSPEALAESRVLDVQLIERDSVRAV